MTFSAHLPRLAAAVGEHLADAATFFRAAGGPGIPCRVILGAPDVALALTDSGASLPDCVIEVAQAALPLRPRQDDYFITGGRRYWVVSQPVDRGGDGQFWTIDVEARRNGV